MRSKIEQGRSGQEELLIVHSCKKGSESIHA